MTFFTSRPAVSRIVSVTAVIAAGALVLAGCAGKKPRSPEDWLADQPFVLGVEVIDTEASDSTMPAAPYSTVLQAELDPLATTADIEKLISDTIREVQPDDELGVHFGILGLDFGVTTRSETADAFALWRDIDDVPDVDRALVLSDSISAHTPRATLVPVFNELADFGVGVRVDGDQDTVDQTVAIVRGPDCEPPAGARELAATETVIEAISFATYDLCDGFDVVYANDTVFDATINGVLAALDAAGLGAFPVRLAVAPAAPASPDFHIVEITPGAREALGIVTALDASAIAMRYELLAPAAEGEPRALVIESDDATLEELHALLAASPASAFLGALTITATDGTFEGDLAELADEVTPAPSATPSPTPTPSP